MKPLQLAEFGRMSPYSEAGNSNVLIPLSDFEPGVHQTDDFIFRMEKNRAIDWVISRTCDHSQGKLFLRSDGRARCPLHNWSLDLDSLTYEGVGVRKKRLAFTIEDGVLQVQASDQFLKLELPEPLAETDVSVRFLAHASLAISAGDTRIVTDPWLVGPCFSTGWWHAMPPKQDVIDVLRDATAVYISHNHPDHLHRETLSYLQRDKPILVPDFPSGSVVSILESLGFTDLRVLPFNTPYRIGGSSVVLAIFQAGDFRDDSGLFVQAGHFSSLLTVDSNRLNNFVLPRPVDLVATSFAGGASGFPLCFEVFSKEEQDKIVARNRHAVSSSAVAYIHTTKARYYMPYAGYFTEAAERDHEIKLRNKKNSSFDMELIVKARAPGVTVLNPIRADHYIFSDGGVQALTEESLPGETASPETVARYISEQRDALSACGDDDIVEYFRNSDYHDALKIYLQPTDDHFRPVGHGFLISFSDDKPDVQMATSDELQNAYSMEPDIPEVNVKLIKVRHAPLCEVVRDGLPWEDLSIGFQCRIHRKPNVYNSGFWYHFSNVYIGERASRR